MPLKRISSVLFNNLYLSNNPNKKEFLVFLYFDHEPMNQWMLLKQQKSPFSVFWARTCAVKNTLNIFHWCNREDPAGESAVSGVIAEMMYGQGGLATEDNIIHTSCITTINHRYMWKDSYKNIQLSIILIKATFAREFSSMNVHDMLLCPFRHE